ncbi:mitochondrial carrier domain-containing protein [Gorgonomyces haynaldii]|nr:mitochondrial carrier domain-containing protein [Gorgonomyces haynaldii]
MSVETLGIVNLGIKYSASLIFYPYSNVILLKQAQYVIPFKKEERTVWKPADASGYLIRTQDIVDPYQLPPITKSTFSTILEIANMNTEGIQSLWKGHWAYFVHDTLAELLQKQLESWINYFLSVQDQFPLLHSEYISGRFLVQMVSSLTTGIILSPLELCKTRMTVQTCRPKHRKYKSLWHTLQTIVREEYPENSFKIIFAAHLFIPTLVYHSVEPLFKLSSLLVDRYISKEDFPLSTLLIDLSIEAIHLLVLVPLETVRTRLQVQMIPKRQQERPFETLVSVSPVPYTGVWDCTYRIVKEEGFRNLYKGLRIRLVSSFMVSLIQLFAQQ